MPSHVITWKHETTDIHGGRWERVQGARAHLVPKLWPLREHSLRFSLPPSFPCFFSPSRLPLWNYLSQLYFLRTWTKAPCVRCDAKQKEQDGQGASSATAASGSQLRKIFTQKFDLLRERALPVEQKDRVRQCKGTVREPWENKKGKKRLGGRRGHGGGAWVTGRARGRMGACLNLNSCMSWHLLGEDSWQSEGPRPVSVDLK